MAEDFFVEISSKSQIKFPEECVVCGRNANGQKGKVHLNRHASSSSENKIEVPMHINCSKKYKIAFWKRNTLIPLIGGLVVIAYRIYAEHYATTEYPVSEIILFIVLFIALIPLLILRSNRPLSIECMHVNDNYIFAFNKRSYAKRFAQINGSELIKRT